MATTPGTASSRLPGRPPVVDLASWQAAGFPCAVRTPEPADWKLLVPGDDPAGAWQSRGVVAVRDAGFTEVAPGTVTVVAQRASS